MSTQNKFAIGDRVRLVTTEHGYICGEDDDRLFQVGCIGTVTNTDWTDGATIAMYGYRVPMYFSYDEFELLEEASPQPPVVEWNGDGLPPVGTVCEWHGVNSDGPDGCFYTESEVVGYSPCGVFIFMQKPSCWPVVERLDNCEFRPIKTKEQLEEEAKAQERDKTLSEMVTDLGAEQPRTREYIICGILYDAGYRKVKQEND